MVCGNHNFILSVDGFGRDWLIVGAEGEVSAKTLRYKGPDRTILCKTTKVVPTKQSFLRRIFQVIGRRRMHIYVHVVLFFTFVILVSSGSRQMPNSRETNFGFTLAISERSSIMEKKKTALYDCHVACGGKIVPLRGTLPFSMEPGREYPWPNNLPQAT